MRVLDAGCGTGAITRGIAEAVGAGGLAVGADASAALVAGARAAHGGVPGLAFVAADACALPFRDAFDVVTAARVLQWLARPADALASMVAATRPGGRVLVLDYDHERVQWTPAPPPAARRFYAAFLRWRTAAGLDNAIAGRLPRLLAAAGLGRVVARTADETVGPGHPALGIWAATAATRGRQMVAGGAITEAERRAGEAAFLEWSMHATRLRLHLRAAEGVRPRRQSRAGRK